MQTLSNLLIVASSLLLLIAWWLRHRSVFGLNHSAKLSKNQEAALLKAWEDYELGLTRSARLPAKGWGSAPMPRNITRFMALLMFAIVALSLVAYILSGAREPFVVAGLLGSLLMLLCFCVTLFVIVPTMMARSIRGHWHRVSPKQPRFPGAGGGVRDEWLDGPQATAVKLRPGRSAASG